MAQDRNPQAEQMGDESMVRNLGFQADAIWPQEQGLFDRYQLAGELRILDVGCGTGALLAALHASRPGLELAGIDPCREMLEVARARLDASADLRKAAEREEAA